jgi:hypothetical protein
MFIGGLASLIFLVWMVAKIWKQSPGLAIVSLLFWPALIFAVFKYWADEESDIKLPFVLFVIATVYAWYDMSQTAKALHEQAESLLSIIMLG